MADDLLALVTAVAGTTVGASLLLVLLDIAEERSARAQRAAEATPDEGTSVYQGTADLVS
jgi:hypothetical protein